MTNRKELLARLEASQKACFDVGQHIAAMDIQSARAALSQPASVAQTEKEAEHQSEMAAWQCVGLQNEIKRLSGLLADAQRIIAEYQASTTAAAKADVAAGSRGMTEHADLPWEIADGIVVCQGGSETGPGPILFVLRAPRGTSKPYPHELLADYADRIVKAVNNHEALVDAVGMACEYLESEDAFKPAGRLREKFLALLADVGGPREP